MRRWVLRGGRCWIFLVIALVGISSPAVRGQVAVPQLLFTLSSPDDLSQLTVGQTAHFSVSLSGLGSSDSLVTLTSGVSFDASLLGTPTASAAGAIVPNPLNDPLDFQTTNLAGEADASFATVSNSMSKQITTNGVFYTFNLVAQAPGSGTIDFDSLALIAELFDSSNPGAPILLFPDAGKGLSYTITSSGSGNPGGGGGGSVPLPIAWQAALGTALLFPALRRRAGFLPSGSARHM